MKPHDAWLYAATWGSFMSNGDPGACMYGFSEDCRPQSEQHRQDCLNWIETECRPHVLARPADYDPDELEKMNAFVAYMTSAPVQGAIPKKPVHVSYELGISELPRDCIEACSAPGAADDAVAHWLEKLEFTVDRERAIDCLQGYGAWDDLQTATDETLAGRVLWLACNDFAEFIVHCDDLGIDPLNPPAGFCPDSGSDVFCLE